uniref:Cleavage/polyadenylation specificity factor A subunit N-terminal domain-containing protein n=1 Tax=Proboscia inermis TaxID=420281 RepID=A0A7S0CLV1_9STRA|mmetsp:Transcript_7070/g.7244  ORF Transcript_7070/g.7244 Transcript_7070/m.7244 type:complete len:325 (+) Transcript_7070:105-1079(+)
MNRHTEAVSDDLVWIVDGSGSHVNVLERNDSSAYSIFQNITTNQLCNDHRVEMDKDGTVLIIRDLEAKKNSVYSLSVYFRKDTKETFEMQQRLDGDSNDDLFGWRTSMTPNGLILVVLSELIHIFSRDKSEEQFLLHHTINMPEEFLRRYLGQTQIALSADGLTLIVVEGNYDVNIVNVFSRNPYNKFTLEQMLEGEEEGDRFGHTLALSRSGNLLVVAAPYASPKLNKEGSIHLYVRNETNKFNHYRRFDGASSFEYLGIGGTMINSTESMLAIHALGLTSCEGGDAFLQTYTLECACVNKKHVCQGFSAFPALVCDDKIPYS